MSSDSGRVVLVTGAAGGMGRAACERMAGHGWKVLAVDRDASKLAWTASVAGIESCVADVTTEEGNESMVRQVIAAFGGLDALILNAGVSIAGALESLPLADFDRMIAVNVRGVLLGMRAALPQLRQRKESAILVVASTHGLAGDAGFSGYSASKHAAVGLARSAARELGKEGIRVNALCPGPTRATGMSSPIETQMPAIFDAIRRAVPLRKWAEPDNIAAAMEFLVSRDAAFITGASLAVDGGALAGSGTTPFLEALQDQDPA